MADKENPDDVIDPQDDYRWKKEDIVPLRRLAEKLKSIGSKDAVTLQNIVSPLETSLEWPRLLNNY